MLNFIIWKSTIISFKKVNFYIILSKYLKKATRENLLALQKEQKLRDYFDSKFLSIASQHGFSYIYQNNSNIRVPEVNSACIKRSVEAFEKSCGKMTDYALKHVKTFAIMCYYQNEE